MFILTVLLLTLCKAIYGEVPYTYKSYDGYQLLQIMPKSPEDVRWINNLESALDEELDFWKETGKIIESKQNIASDSGKVQSLRATELLVNKDQKEKVYGYLKKHGIESEVKIEDVGKVIRDDATTSLLPEGAAFDSAGHFDLNEYHSHAEIISNLQVIAKENNDFVKLDSIGKSYEGRNLALLKIGYPSNKTKNVLFVDAGIHAREWITPAVALHLIDKLVNNKTLRTLLEEIDIWVLPSLNPDGYEYSRLVDRLWRKSRTGPRGPRDCFGVDINRNFDFYWAFSGVSHNPCSEIYCGPKELSENESKSLAKFLRANNESIKAYITLHSYGNLLIHPWGHIEHSYPPDIEDIYNAGVDAAKAIEDAGGPSFVIGAGPQILYEVAGSSQDFAKSVGIKYTYTMELTNTPSGFIFPKHKIEPTANQIIPGLLVFADRAKKETGHR